MEETREGTDQFNMDRDAVKGFLVWQLKSMIVLVVFGVFLIAFPIFASKPISLGDALILFIVLAFWLRILILFMDRIDLLRAMRSVRKSLKLQGDMPPSMELLYGLDSLRDSLLKYVSSAQGHMAVSDVYIPRLKQQINLTFICISEMIHRLAWKSSKIFGGGGPSSEHPEIGYAFLQLWTNELAKQLLGSRRALRLLEHRVLALSYFFEDTISYFAKEYSDIHKRSVKLFEELISRQEERLMQRRQLRVEIMQVSIPVVISAALTTVVSLLTGA